MRNARDPGKVEGDIHPYLTNSACLMAPAIAKTADKVRERKSSLIVDGDQKICNLTVK
jgi:hypothetical protein